jgi:CheY-like chemotaxis protein
MISHGGNILVVDDLVDWRDMIGGLLEDAGYHVKTAADADEAMRFLRQHPYHVAVVDLRLDERDENNQEGLTLAEQMKAYLPELAIIILTGYASIPAIKRAMQPQQSGDRIAFNFLEKHEISQLLPSINAALTQSAKVNPQLTIELKPALSWSKLQSAIECLQSLDPPTAKLELKDLLQRIFYEAQAIEVSPMNGGHSSGAVVRVTPNTRGLFQTDVVVKFNDRAKAERESHNYDNYVDKYVGGARRTQRLDFRATARLGGIAYSFVGAEATKFQRFNHIYATQEAASIEDILGNLFKETCYTWYTNTLKPNNLPSLSAGYKEWLRLDTKKLTTAVTEIIERTNGQILSFADPRRPNQSPLLLVERAIMLTNPLPLSQAAFAYDGPFCFTHGDLHEGNILVDSHNQTWLIDFYHTGLGHPVRDFAMLESAIKFSLQQSPCPLTVLHDWERMLLQTNSLTQISNPTPPLHLDAELTKATMLVRHVRSLLSQIVPHMTLRDYQISLYFHALKALTLPQKLNERQRLHTLMCAAILAETLQ